MTTSGKFEILFDKDILKEVDKIDYNKEKYKENNNTFRILTTHSRESLFSQHYMDKEEKADAYINSSMAEKCGFNDGEHIYIESSKGKIQVKLKIDDSIGDDIVMMYAGWWKKHGNPNMIIDSGISDIGGQVTYNETFVRLIKTDF